MWAEASTVIKGSKFGLKERLGKAAIETGASNITDKAAENGIDAILWNDKDKKNRQSQ